MTALPQIFRSERVITPSGEMPATVHVSEGRIESVRGYDDLPGDADAVELGSLVLLPGFVDAHVHINEPGRSGWEGFATATRAAAAGGVTTLVDMPLNSVPPTTTVAALGGKIRAADSLLSVDVAFWGGVVPGNLGELRALYEAGAAGFKCFLAPSGVDEFQHVSMGEAESAMEVLAPLGAPLLVHAEDPTVLARAQAATGGTPQERTDFHAYERSRPAEAELEAIHAVLAAAERTGARVHIVHVATADGLSAIRAARDRGVHVSGETCPHYLWFASEEVPPGGTQWKCAPPIRSAANRRRLRDALRDGLVDMIASDHSPAPAELKSTDGDFFRAWGGIASLQIGPLVTWTVAAAEGCTLHQLATWMSAAPAALAGLDRQKGGIAPGMDADLVAFDPDSEVRINAMQLQHRHKITPYDGVILRGRVHRTWLRGAVVHDEGGFARPLHGRALLRRHS
ncbi:MAG TPA: allantoinase AllB [Gemmatimonadaceae bacterium]|nr:allantoinase AllB [Gemmatimonadaceae bacterium]